MLTDSNNRTKKKTSKTTSKVLAKEVSVPSEETVEEKSVPEENIIDINIALPTKSRFRINGDSSKILELNTSDMGILKRIETGVKDLQKQVAKVSDISPEDEDLIQKLDVIDKAMRKQIDYIFDSNVSEICASNGTMYDVYGGGQLRYEHILDALLGLYEDNINREYKKLKTRMQKHTNKYVR